MLHTGMILTVMLLKVNRRGEGGQGEKVGDRGAKVGGREHQ